MVKIDIKDKIDGKEIDLSLSELVEVPVKELASLTKVTHVDLSCNHIQGLPASFCSLTHIIRLDLSKNELTELPQNFGSLRQLQYLDLYANQLTSLPVSLCQLKHLSWLDLKNNPLNQKLKAVASDCLDEKQCRECAKKVVEYLKTINSEMERQRQKTLQQEREREAVRIAEEQLEERRQKEQKKAERLRRKAERQEEKLREMMSRENEESERSGATGHSDCDLKQNGFVPAQKKSKFGSLIKWLILLMIVLPFLVLCGEIAYQAYRGKNVVVSVAQLRQLALEDWAVAKNKAFATWELVVSEEKRLLQLLTAKWKRWYASVPTDSQQDL